MKNPKDGDVKFFGDGDNIFSAVTLINFFYDNYFLDKAGQRKLLYTFLSSPYFLSLKIGVLSLHTKQIENSKFPVQGKILQGIFLAQTQSLECKGNSSIWGFFLEGGRVQGVSTFISSTCSKEYFISNL